MNNIKGFSCEGEGMGMQSKVEGRVGKELEGRFSRQLSLGERSSLRIPSSEQQGKLKRPNSACLPRRLDRSLLPPPPPPPVPFRERRISWSSPELNSPADDTLSQGSHVKPVLLKWQQMIDTNSEMPLQGTRSPRREPMPSKAFQDKVKAIPLEAVERMNLSLKSVKLPVVPQVSRPIPTEPVPAYEQSGSRKLNPRKSFKKLSQKLFNKTKIPEESTEEACSTHNTSAKGGQLPEYLVEALSGDTRGVVVMSSDLLYSFLSDIKREPPPADHRRENILTEASDHANFTPSAPPHHYRYK